jgi:TonB family protein
MRTKLTFLLMVCALGPFGFSQSATSVGYIYCAKGKRETSVLVFFDGCAKHQVGNFPCGHQIEVVAQLGQVFKVRTSAGSTVFVDRNAVSQKAEEFMPVEISAEQPPDCSVKTPEYDLKKNHGPRAVFQPEPDYPSTAPRSHDEKIVALSLVVGVDGQPRNIKVESSPGKDFAKSAVEAVRNWRYEPGLKDGQPIEMTIKVEVTFRLIY